MRNRITLLIIIFYCFVFTNVEAQEKNECACCTEFHDQFDFWLGEWTVFNTKGEIVGKNTITKEYSNCVLKEQWESKKGNNGTSYNFFDSKEKTWNQLWVDNSGFNLTLKGSYVNDKMILKSDLLEGSNGKYYNQITWQLNEDKSVTQIWELFSEDHKLVQQAFKGIYKKSVK